MTDTALAIVIAVLAVVGLVTVLAAVTKVVKDYRARAALARFWREQRGD